MKHTRLLLAGFALLPLAAQASEVTLTLKDHQFVPSEITLPAGEKHTLIVKNEDASPAEFESHTLHREKVIKGGKEAKINIGPLKAGRYEFFDEFHEASAKGVLVIE